MAMFLTLTTFPAGEPDLDEIIDKAGAFLLDQNDNSSATRLYRAATLAPADYALPRNNLRELDNRMRSTRRTRGRQT